MRCAQVVIGANYGDEGKGLITDFFASNLPEHSLVIRFNGGAQAGHTVVEPDGRRHVFSHFASGSFINCPSYLSQYFIVNPLIFVKEYEELFHLGVIPKCFIHSLSMLSTPVDIFINQYIEQKRAGARHGSCGLGINETVTRCLRANDYESHVSDCFNLKDFTDKLQILFSEWLPSRLKELGIKEIDYEVENFISKKNLIIEKYKSDIKTMLLCSQLSDVIPNDYQLIFEGAQGLMLDEDRLDQFPYLTRSKTGLFNVIRLAAQCEIDCLDVTYVTRSYLTRHGAGPLIGEADWKFADFTNIPNQFQGNLRFAPLDLNSLFNSIELDLKQNVSEKIQINPNLAITCLDQKDITLGDNMVFPLAYLSYGPKRTDVINLEHNKSVYQRNSQKMLV